MSSAIGGVVLFSLGPVLIAYREPVTPSSTSLTARCLCRIGVLQLVTPIGATLTALWFRDQEVSPLQTASMAFVIVILALFTIQRSARSEIVVKAAGP